MKKQLLLTLLIFTFSCSGHVLFAQYSTIFNFNGSDNGKYPHGTLYFDGQYLYGTTGNGGTADYGTIFKVLPDGTNYTTLVEFNFVNGKTPLGNLISDGTFLYGTTWGGGTFNKGTIYKLKPDGSDFQVIYHMPGIPEALAPYGSLVFDGTYLYGTTEFGGDFYGHLFKILPDGSDYQNVYSFEGGSTGKYPRGSPLLLNNKFYGTTRKGGTIDSGVLYRIGMDGSDSTIFKFDGENGAEPRGDLISDGTYLYGFTKDGGLNDIGTIFKIMPDGTDFTKLLDFDSSLSGANPSGSLLLNGSALYGVAEKGGLHDLGTMFKINTDGSDFVKLVDFDSTSTGNTPLGSLISIGTAIYGTTQLGGENNMGVVFIYGNVPTGLINQQADEFTLFPNPCAEQCELKTSVYMDDAELNLWNLSGQLIRKIIHLKGHSALIDQGDLPDGMYFIQLIDNDKLLYSGKLIMM